MKTCIIVGAGGRGKDAYAPILAREHLLRVVGVAEPDADRRHAFCETYGIAENMAFDGWQSLFSQRRLADAVLICTQDRMHLAPTLAAIRCGYHILLEKPISPLTAEIDILEDALVGYDCVFMTGFVLRYTPFIRKIRALIDAGAIGDVMNMQLNENEGYWHHAHSYVRGQWNNADTSSPLIVAKSCHDFDLMLYLLGRHCTHIASYGTNGYFKAANAPGNVPARCTDGCAFADSCKYNAVRQYTAGEGRYFVHKFGCGTEDAAIIEALRSNPYGRCVYHCDNNVCDHQVAALEFEGGIAAVFTVSAFSQRNTRTIKLMGTEGEIGGCMEDGEIVLHRFADGTTEHFTVTHDGTKHCGGDGGLMRRFAEAVNADERFADARIFEAHRLALEAERVRKRNES